MLEVMLLAGSLSVDLEPYAVENPEANTYQLESSTDAYGRPFQWSTQSNRAGKSILMQDNNRSGDYFDGVERDAFGRPVEGED